MQKMKKRYKPVGIITMFHKSSNYGGILQAYALVKVLKKHEIEAEQIRYDNFSAFSFKRRLKNTLYRLFSLVRYPGMLKYQRKIRKRVKIIRKASAELVPHSREVYTERNIRKCKDNYEAFITGSDQVWHGEWPAYFLEFVPGGIKKIAYAASTGKSRLSSSDINNIKGYVEDFAAISIREEDTAEVLRAAIPDMRIEWVLDPTLLLDELDWDEITTARRIDNPYMFCYFLGSDIRIRELARMYADRHDLKIVTIPHMQGSVESSDIEFGDVQVYDSTPQDFLGLIKYAGIIFTDSFHATIFASVFRRQFVAFGRTERKEMNNRMKTLTEMLGIGHRFISDDEEYTIEYIGGLHGIDYSHESVNYKKMKEKSLSFLINAINY